jgi:hypothetical protein
MAQKGNHGRFVQRSRQFLSKRRIISYQSRFAHKYSGDNQITRDGESQEVA